MVSHKLSCSNQDFWDSDILTFTFLKISPLQSDNSCPLKSVILPELFQKKLHTSQNSGLGGLASHWLKMMQQLKKGLENTLSVASKIIMLHIWAHTQYHQLWKDTVKWKCLSNLCPFQSVCSFLQVLPHFSVQASSFLINACYWSHCFVKFQPT